MKQENFLFVDVISSFFLVILLLCNFLGLVYLTNGNLLISLLGSLLIVICYYFVLQLLKKNKQHMSDVGYLKSPASMFLVVFIVFGFASYVFTLHLVNIETNCRAQLQKEAEEKMASVKNLTAEYNRVANESLQSFEAQFKNKLLAYKMHRTNILRNELSQAPFSLPEAILNSPSPTIDIAASTNAIVNAHRIKVGENSSLLDSVVSRKADYYTASFKKWDRLNLSENYSALNGFAKASLDLVNGKLKELPLQNEPLAISTSGKALPLGNPLELARIYPPDYLVPFLIILMMHLFILIPFWTHRVRIYTRCGERPSPSEGGVVNRGEAIEI